MMAGTTLIVIPAQAGIHSHRLVLLGPGFRRDDKQGSLAIPVLSKRL